MTTTAVSLTHGRSPSVVVPGPHAPAEPHQTWFWLWIMCLAGVDYFSTLGYQPSIAFEHTGLLAPIATVVVVLVTLFGALPVYCHVAAESPNGQGSISMLEKLLRGWTGKFVVLTLLGFAATDFIITKTLSAADAAAHLIHNPFWKEAPSFLIDPVKVTMLLLVILGGAFLRGLREVITLAVVLVGAYLLLNAIVIGGGVHYLFRHPELVVRWYEDLRAGNWHLPAPPLSGQGWLTIAGICLLLFPKLALGLSGFETGVLLNHLVRGDEADEAARPQGRIRNTRKLLLTAALIMAVYLLGSTFITSTLIPVQELVEAPVPGRAVDRALAYLAHGEPIAHAEAGAKVTPWAGDFFGTIYDGTTVLILWFAGASAMAGLLNLIPQYLPRYGMAPEWTRSRKALVVILTAVNLLVTWIFEANVSAQSGAYATGVLVLMTSSCLATLIHVTRTPAGSAGNSWRKPATLTVYGLITCVFVYTTAAIVVEKPEGIQIAGCFIGAVVIASMASRAARSTELRFIGFQFTDDHSRFLWDSLKHLEFPVLVPHRPDGRDLAAKEESIRREHHLTGDIPVVFVEAELGDPSEFNQNPLMEIRQEGERFVIRVTRCVSIAHVIAAVGLELSKFGKPPEIHFGWSDESPMTVSIGWLLFGEGNVPWMVRQLIRKAEADEARRPRVVIG